LGSSHADGVSRKLPLRTDRSWPIAALSKVRFDAARLWRLLLQL